MVYVPTANTRIVMDNNAVLLDLRASFMCYILPLIYCLYRFVYYSISGVKNEKNINELFDFFDKCVTMQI